MKKRRKPEVGDNIRLLTGHFKGRELIVEDLLAILFTVALPKTGGILFLYYERLMGEKWEFVT